MVENGVLVGAVVTNKRIAALFAGRLSDDDFFAVDARYCAGAFGGDRVTGRTGDNALHACSHTGTLRLNERQSLAHHATTHEGEACIIVLEEWNKGRTNRQENLAG